RRHESYFGVRSIALVGFSPVAAHAEKLADLGANFFQSCKNVRVRFDFGRQFISAKTDLCRADEPRQVARIHDRHIDGLAALHFDFVDNVSGREQFSSYRSTGIDEMKFDLGSGTGDAVDLIRSMSDHSPFAHWNIGNDHLFCIRIEISARGPGSTAGARSLSTAKGPTAEEMFPQFPSMSTNGSVMLT